MSSKTINNLISAPDHEGDEGVDTTELVRKLCQVDKEDIWATGNFHITLDRAVLLYAMIGKRKVVAGQIICNNIIDSIKPLMGLWFPANITHLCIQSDVEVRRDRRENHSWASRIYQDIKTSSNAPQIGGQKVGGRNTHLGGAEAMTENFTMTNASSDKHN